MTRSHLYAALIAVAGCGRPLTVVDGATARPPVVEGDRVAEAVVGTPPGGSFSYAIWYFRAPSRSISRCSASTAGRERWPA